MSLCSAPGCWECCVCIICLNSGTGSSSCSVFSFAWKSIVCFRSRRCWISSWRLKFRERIGDKMIKKPWPLTMNRRKTYTTDRCVLRVAGALLPNQTMLTVASFCWIIVVGAWLGVNLWICITASCWKSRNILLFSRVLWGRGGCNLSCCDQPLFPCCVVQIRVFFKETYNCANRCLFWYFVSGHTAGLSRIASVPLHFAFQIRLVISCDECVLKRAQMGLLISSFNLLIFKIWNEKHLCQNSLNLWWKSKLLIIQLKPIFFHGQNFIFCMTLAITRRS